MKSNSLSELQIFNSGSKRTGNTSLLHRMTGQPFSESYVPTPITHSRKIRWFPRNRPTSPITITITDTVSVNPKLSSTFKPSPDGVIVLIDGRNQEIK
jgi:hypothetical protein